MGIDVDALRQAFSRQILSLKNQLMVKDKLISKATADMISKGLLLETSEKEKITMQKQYDAQMKKLSQEYEDKLTAMENAKVNVANDRIERSLKRRQARKTKVSQKLEEESRKLFDEERGLQGVGHLGNNKFVIIKRLLRIIRQFI